jgi:hypothetical protein
MSEQQLDSIELVERDADFVKRWFHNTISLIEQEVHPGGAADMVCVTAMAVSGNYSKSIYDLLRLNHHMPVKALLRVVCELSSKLAWCMITPKSRGKDKASAIEKKIVQWEKNSLYKKLNIMEEFRYIVSEEKRSQLEESITATKKKIKSIPGAQMPRTIEIFYKLSKTWRSSIYTRGYLQFNDAVHIDLGTLASKIDKNGNRIDIKSDTAEELTELSGYCAAFMYQIYFIVRSHFGWDTKQISDELRELGAERIPLLSQ